MTESLGTGESVYGTRLARLFEDSTNSYKYVFFLAILNLVEQRNTRLRLPLVFALQDVAIEAAAIAWFPQTFFRLSFGVQDKLSKKVELLNFDTKERLIAHDSTQQRLRQAIQEQYDVMQMDEFLRYVPYRLLAPFFKDRLQGVNDGQKNALIAKYAAESFESDIPALYKFLGTTELSIKLHVEWVEFLVRNLPIIRGWAKGAWINYLQRRNPNVPAIPYKIEAPAMRSPMEMQKDYWRSIMREKSIKCIYSDELLDLDNFSLDHFIPWSFVCHDQLWNLVPVLPKANSSKGNRLPAHKYVDGFMQLQIDGLAVAYEAMQRERWIRFTESFVSDFRVSQSDLVNVELMKTTFEGALPAMISLAEQTGFSPDWEYRQ